MLGEDQNEENIPGEYKLKKEVAAFIWETIKIIVISLAIIIPIRYYLVQPFFVKGASMENTFQDNDYILIDEISYRFKEPQRGDVIVFHSPEDMSQFFIKRIVALPGETIRIRNNQVMIFNSENPGGFVLNEGYLDSSQRTVGDITRKMDPNEYFVLGDNRLESSDSRRWGEVNKALIIGKVFVKVWPIKEFGLFEKTQYQ